MSAQITDRKPLKHLADTLRRLAGEHPGENQRHELQHGLRLALRYKEGEWQLGIWRREVVPSEQEVDICRECFAVPEDALQSYELHQNTMDGLEWRGYVVAWNGPAR